VDGMKVGLCWGGDSEHTRNRDRSASLELFGILRDLPGVHWVSVQKGAPRREPVPDGFNLIDMTDQLRDFADTAALIANLDLVISVDTAVAHLAGALGKPVWTLISYAPDWRWLLDREDSPWYPTMRLFRQRMRRDWVEVMQRVREALADLTASRYSK
ncbi:MAG TPA: glycosyltransferase family 9 protein, partial [Tepidisphaeraceae bacterium]|nr:glycosyltransferase family 9 protein [Tepidisphaeraceae bacterium]